MRPLPQHLRHVFNADALGGREKPNLAATGLQLHDGHGLGPLAAGELVGLGQHHQKLQSGFHAGADDVEQYLVQLGQPMARVAHQHNAFEVLARDQVVGHDLLPANFVGLGHGGVAVAGQVGQHGVGNALFAQGKQVDVLGAAGFFGGKRQLFLLRQGVDAGGLARIGAAHKGDFRHVQWGQKVKLGCGRQKFGGVQPAHGDHSRRFFCRRGGGWRGTRLKRLREGSH